MEPAVSKLVLTVDVESPVAARILLVEIVSAFRLFVVAVLAVNVMVFIAADEILPYNIAALTAPPVVISFVATNVDIVNKFTNAVIDDIFCVDNCTVYALTANISLNAPFVAEMLLVEIVLNNAVLPVIVLDDI